MENELKVSKRIQKIHGKSLSVYKEYGDFRVVCSTQNHLLTHGKYLNIFGEYVERIYAYMETQRDSWVLAYSPNTPRDINCHFWVTNGQT